MVKRYPSSMLFACQPIPLVRILAFVDERSIALLFAKSIFAIIRRTISPGEKALSVEEAIRPFPTVLLVRWVLGIDELTASMRFEFPVNFPFINFVSLIVDDSIVLIDDFDAPNVFVAVEDNFPVS